jgi:hypothetical protein
MNKLILAALLVILVALCLMFSTPLRQAGAIAQGGYTIGR